MEQIVYVNFIWVHSRIKEFKMLYLLNVYHI